MLSQKPKPIGSIISDVLTTYVKATFLLSVYKNSRNEFVREIVFKIENESDDENQSSPKLARPLTVLEFVLVLISKFGNPNMGRCEWLSGKSQNGVKFDFYIKLDLKGQGQSTPQITTVYDSSLSTIKIVVN